MIWAVAASYLHDAQKSPLLWRGGSSSALVITSVQGHIYQWVGSTHAHIHAALINLKHPHIHTQEVMMYISCSVGPRCAHRTSAKPEWNIHTGAPIYISQPSSTAKFGRWKYFLCCAPHPCSCCLPELWLFDTAPQNNKGSFLGSQSVLKCKKQQDLI